MNYLTTAQAAKRIDCAINTARIWLSPPDKHHNSNSGQRQNLYLESRVEQCRREHPLESRWKDYGGGKRQGQPSRYTKKRKAVNDPYNVIRQAKFRGSICKAPGCTNPVRTGEYLCQSHKGYYGRD